MFGLDFVKKAKEMQEKMEVMQKELESKIVEGTSANGKVSVKATGKQSIFSVSISPEILSSRNADEVSALVMMATNDALDRSKQMMANELSKITGGMKLPGLF